MRKAIFLFITLIFLLPAIGFAANTYEVHLIVSDYVFGPAENISLTGYINNISSNATANVTTVVASASVSVSILNSTNDTVSNYTFTTDVNGSFYSNSSFHPDSATVTAPNTTGTYTILANYSQNGTWTARASIVVASTVIDDIQFQLPKVSFYAAENMTITAKAVQRVGDSYVAVANVSVNITIRYENETTISNFSCATGTAGTCNVTTLAPSTAGTYILEANNFVGFTNFKVAAFDVEAYMKDSSALSFKNIFARSESGFVEIRVSYNGTVPSGTYNATATIVNSTGGKVHNLSSVILNSTNGFVDKLSFTVTSTMPVGFYTVNVSVAKTGGSTVNTTTNFLVRDWSLTFAKAAKNSGFEYGYTAFVNRTVFFDVFPVNRSSGDIIENVTNNFTVLLKNSLGSVLSNTTVTYNASCGAKACYQFNITMPVVVGDYTLSVALNYSSDYQTADRTLRATDITASAQPSDSSGAVKEIFGTNEFIYITLTAKNQTTNISVTQAELTNMMYENGTKLIYSQNTSAMNLSDTTYEWALNSSGTIIIDPPKTGGTYLIEIYVNNKSAAVTTRVGVNPYDVCTSAKGSADTSTSDYWYQFRTSDTIYFQVTISEAQNKAGRVTNTSDMAGVSSSYGRSSQCSFNTAQKRSVTNATITIEKVLNMNSGNAETLNTTASTCSATDNSGGYLCTVKASDNNWDGGRHIATFNVVGDDNLTKDKANGFFEARAFYIYGYSSNWANKATSNITLNLNVYEAGSGWWNSGSGLSGTALIDSINFYGGVGEWIWPPIKYDYNVTGLNITLSNGVGTVTLDANRSATGSWASGYYSAVIKATVNDEVDYGEAWFNIRNWDTYATAVEVSGNSFIYKSSVHTSENATLYVRITEAGGYNDYSGGQSIGGNVTVTVKKIVDYSQWPAVEMPSSNFTATTINVNASSPWYSSANVNTHGKYLINISPTSGSWESGYYSVVLDVNGTEGGYGWFDARAFYIDTRPTNVNGSAYVYNHKGDGPVYLNITTTRSWKSSYNTSDYVNATITEAVLRLWDETTYSQKEYVYPTDFNLSPTRVNGSGIINVSYLGGNWPSGYYNGELKMRNLADNSTQKGWIWFSVQPFRVSSTSSYNVGVRDNVTVNLTVYEPDWSSSTIQNGNFTVVSVEDNSWTGGFYSKTNLNFSYTNTSGLFTNTSTLTIYPPGGKWSSGYRSGTIIVKDNDTNSTRSTWFSFRATLFIDSVTRKSAQNMGPTDNVTVNITLTTTGGAAATGNLSSVFYWGWPDKTAYRFIVGECDSAVNGSCFINGSANVTVVAPSGGWSEGYNYVYFEYTESDDSTSKVESSSNAYFYVRQPLTGYMYSVNDNGGWMYDFGATDNVTMYLYSLQNLSGSSVTVNVTNVQIAKTSDNCWSESCRSYENTTWEVVILSGGSFVNNDSTGINSSGYVRINATNGTWDLSSYNVRIFVTDNATGQAGILKDASFRVKDMTAPVVNITSPTAEQVINATTFIINATTSERSVCYINIYDYGTYNNTYCNNANGTVPSACNETKYNTSTTYYYSYASQWWNSRGGQTVSTDSTAHSYNHSSAGMTVPQNYTVVFDCYDTDWNFARNATTFYVTGTGNTTNATAAVNASVTINITLPQNTTYQSRDQALTFNLTNNTVVSACWYILNGGSNTTISDCASTGVTATYGYNNITLYANISNGTTFNSSMRFFTIGNITVNVSSPANITYNSTNVTLNYTVSASPASCYYVLNGGNNTNLTSCGNITFTASEGYNNITVYGTNATGTAFNSSVRYFTVTSSGNITISLDSPANTTYNTTSITLNYTISNTTEVSACWYRLNTTNTSLTNCANTTFTASEWVSNITLFANNSAGTTFNSSTVFFTVDTTGLLITFVSPTQNTTNITVNFTYVNVTVNEVASAALLEFNGTNYTMLNPSTLSWYRNHTMNTTGNYTFRVYANDTANNWNVSESRWLVFNLT